MFKNFLGYVFYNLLYIIERNGIIHAIAQIENATKTSLPIFYTWDEEYINRIEYLRRRSNGENITFRKVEEEYLNAWNNELQKSLRGLEILRAKSKTK